MAREGTGSTSNYMRLASPAVTDVPVTMACWASTDDVANRKTAIGLFNSGLNSNYLQLLLSGNLTNDPVSAEQSGSSGVQRADSSAGLSASTDTWFHACAVFASDSSRTAYYNGGNAGTNSNSAGNTVGVDRLSLFMFDGSGAFNPWDGELCEFGVWNVALTADEVAALGAGWTPAHVRPESLIYYWPVSGRYSPEIDLAGAADISITGTLAYADHYPVIQRPHLLGPFAAAAAVGGGTHPVGPFGHPLHGPFAGAMA